VTVKLKTHGSAEIPFGRTWESKKRKKNCEENGKTGTKPRGRSKEKRTSMPMRSYQSHRHKTKSSSAASPIKPNRENKKTWNGQRNNHARNRGTNAIGFTLTVQRPLHELKTFPSLKMLGGNPNRRCEENGVKGPSMAPGLKTGNLLDKPRDLESLNARGV